MIISPSPFLQPNNISALLAFVQIPYDPGPPPTIPFIFSFLCLVSMP